MSSDSTTSARILKSSALVGGSQAVKLVIGMVQTKALAIYLGPSGVGLMGTYMNLTGLVGTVAGMGIGSSGVRQVAEAHGAGDQARMGRTVLALRRAVWALGLLGMVLTAALAWPLSRWTFGNGDHTWALVALGLTLLLGNLAMGQTALLQGTRRIADLAKLNIATATAGAGLAVAGFAWAGERAIVPVILATSAASLAIGWRFARRVPVPEGISCGWRESWSEVRPLLGLGLSFMWSGLVTTLVAWATRALIIRMEGMEEVGIYQAAFGVSGIFVGFILGAMGADFYPALTAVAKDNEAANRLVRQQTEIGVLLATPGLIATLVFAPWVIRIFYSGEFAPAAELLRWFTLGCFGRVLSWPMGFLLLAKGEGRLFALTESVFNALHLLLIGLGLYAYGLAGVAYAFAALYLAHLLGMAAVSIRLTGYRFALRPHLPQFALIAAAFLVPQLLPYTANLLVASALTLVALTASLRRLLRLLPPDHRILKAFRQIPGLHRLCAHA